MIEKTIKYVDYNGVERIEKFYFNLSTAEILRMEIGTPGGFVDRVQRIIDSQDQVEIVDIFEELIRKSYGVKTADGKRFVKSDELFEEFSQTEAYSKLYLQLATDADAASEFVNGIIPAKNINQQLEELNNRVVPFELV